MDASLGSGGGGNGNGNGGNGNGKGNGKAKKKAGDSDDGAAAGGDGFGVIDGVRFMTNCSIRFAGGVTLVDSVFGTTGDAAQGGAATVSAPSSLTLGRDDSCAAGGGSRVLVDGDFRAAAKLALHGSQIVATGDVRLAAHANGLDGVSVLSGGDIDVSSRNAFGSCDGSDFAVPGFDYAVVN